jgi:hypothetical protein
MTKTAPTITIRHLRHLVPEDATIIPKPDQVPDLVDLFFKKALWANVLPLEHRDFR